MDKRLQKNIMALYQRGMSMRRIAEMLHISHESVRASIPREMVRHKRMDAATKRKIIESFKRNRSFQETADQLNLTNRCVVYRTVKSARII